MKWIGKGEVIKSVRFLVFAAFLLAAAFFPSTRFSRAWSSCPCALCSSRICDVAGEYPKQENELGVGGYTFSNSLSSTSGLSLDLFARAL